MEDLMSAAEEKNELILGGLRKQITALDSTRDLQMHMIEKMNSLIEIERSLEIELQ